MATDTTPGGRIPGWPVVLALLVLAAAALRIPACFNDFWLDEVWSLLLSQQLDSALGVFTDLKHDNNHHLNTLILYALGDRDDWIVYRIPALLAGVAAVALAGGVARRVGALDGALAALLTGASYLLIHFGTEARGYAFSTAAAFATWWAVQRFAEQPGTGRAALLWLCAALGLLSHLLYVHALVAGGIWLAWRCFARGLGAARFALAYGPPLAMTAAVYAFLVRGMLIGGGPPYVLGPLLVKTGSYAAGGPASGAAALAVALLALAACLAALVQLARAGRDAWLFFASAIFLSPLALWVASPPAVLFERYFLTSVSFGLLAVSHGLAALVRRGGPLRALALALLLAYLGGNAWHLADLYATGRGGYRAAVAYLAEHTAGDTITVAGDDDIGTKMLLVYYQRFLPPGKRMHYFEQDEHPPRPPLWLIRRRYGVAREPDPTVRGAHGGVYRLERSYPSSDLSGAHWYLYRRQAPGARSS